MNFPVIYTVPQLSPEWFEIRKGKLTASNFAAACGESIFKSPENLANEIKYGITKPPNDKMLYGIEKEGEARNYYKEITKNEVIEIGLASIGKISCSPDGIIVKDGKWDKVLEIKCPITYPKNYPKEEYENLNFMYKEHYYQIQGNLHILGLKNADYLIYSSNYQKIFEVEYDEDFCNSMFSTLDEFIIKNKI